MLKVSLIFIGIITLCTGGIFIGSAVLAKFYETGSIFSKKSRERINTEDMEKFHQFVIDLEKYAEIMDRLNNVVPNIQTPQESKRKSNEEIAKEVLAGKWGNIHERKIRLERAGYNYEVIRALVNCSYKLHL